MEVHFLPYPQAVQAQDLLSVEGIRNFIVCDYSMVCDYSIWDKCVYIYIYIYIYF